MDDYITEPDQTYDSSMNKVSGYPKLFNTAEKFLCYLVRRLTHCERIMVMAWRFPYVTVIHGSAQAYRASARPRFHLVPWWLESSGTPFHSCRGQERIYPGPSGSVTNSAEMAR